MKEKIIKLLSENLPLSGKEISNLIEIPPSPELGDYSFPCFVLSKTLKKNPNEIALNLSKKIFSEDFEKVEAKGPYLNFFINSNSLAKETLNSILKQKEKYGSSAKGRGKKILIDMSSPNIAKPFGIGHLRSTIIGNSISEICNFLKFKVVKINYLGDWGTPFGKIIAGYKEFGNEEKLKKEPIKHLYEIYTRASKDESFEEKGREWFRKLEANNKEAILLWKKFRDLSIKEFEKIYSLLNIKFDVIAGESNYNKKMDKIIAELQEKNLIEKSDNALIVNLEKYNLGAGLIQKADGATLYLTRDITAAIDRYKRYKFVKMFYEVGSEQRLHFKQLFKVLQLMGYKWADHCIHIDHGLYLDKDGKKFATRKGKTIFMEDIFEETKELAEKEIKKREKLGHEEINRRALAIARAAIIYGDLKNYRVNDMLFDIDKFISFEGNTGPYLLYSYARAKSILRKAGYSPKKSYKINSIAEKEKQLISKLSSFPEIVSGAYSSLAPNLIANYSYELSQLFNEFYHAERVLGSQNEQFRLALVDAFSQVLKNSLFLLGIPVLEQM